MKLKANQFIRSNKPKKGIFRRMKPLICSISAALVLSSCSFHPKVLSRNVVGTEWVKKGTSEQITNQETTYESKFLRSGIGNASVSYKESKIKLEVSVEQRKYPTRTDTILKLEEYDEVQIIEIKTEKMKSVKDCKTDAWFIPLVSSGAAASFVWAGLDTKAGRAVAFSVGTVLSILLFTQFYAPFIDCKRIIENSRENEPTGKTKTKTSERKQQTKLQEIEANKVPAQSGYIDVEAKISDADSGAVVEPSGRFSVHNGVATIPVKLRHPFYFNNNRQDLAANADVSSINPQCMTGIREFIAQNAVERKLILTVSAGSDRKVYEFPILEVPDLVQLVVQNNINNRIGTAVLTVNDKVTDLPVTEARIDLKPISVPSPDYLASKCFRKEEDRTAAVQLIDDYLYGLLSRVISGSTDFPVFSGSRFSLKARNPAYHHLERVLVFKPGSMDKTVYMVETGTKIRVHPVPE